MDNNISPDEVVNEVVETTVETPQTNALADAMWNDTPMLTQVVDETKPVETTIEEKPKEEFNTFDEIDYLKKNFEVDSIDAIKAEREELKQLREKKQEEIKFANDESKMFFDLWKEGKIDEANEIWAKKKQIERLTNGDVNESNAPDIIKTLYKEKYGKDFTDADAERKFNKQYGIPKEPKKGEFEDDTEFQDKYNDWKDKVAEIKADIVLDAKIARPELEQLRSKITFPEIEQAQQAPTKPTQEDLDNLKREHDEFVLTANKALNEFTGFSAQVKDKDVDFSVNYTPSKEEKELVGSVLQKFAENNFNANAILAERWLNADKTINVGQITKDVLRLYTSDKSEAKIANDAAGQRMEHYLKTRKNINLKDVNEIQTSTNIGNKTQSEVLQEQFWSN